MVSADGIDVDDVADVLSHLVARSMVVADPSAADMRYHLLETMRQYAQERLDIAGESDHIRRRHAEYYITLSEAAAQGVKGREETRWVSTLDAEYANLNAALDWTIGVGDAGLALRLSIALGTLVGIPGLVSSGNLALAAEQLREMDAAFEEAGLELSARAHITHAAHASVVGDVAEATRHGDASIAIALRDGDRHLAGWNCMTLAMFLATAGDDERALRLADQGYAIGRDLGNPTLCALSDITVGYALSTSDPDAAIPRLETGLVVLRALDNQTLRYSAERCLARLLVGRGELRHALEINATVLDLSTRSDINLQTLGTCESVAVDLAAAGYSDVAATIFGALEALTHAYRGNPIVGRAAAIETLRRTMSETHFDESMARGRSLDIEHLARFTRAALSQITEELAGR